MTQKLVEPSYPMQSTWEYRVETIHARHNDTLEEALNTRGREGWELTFMHLPIPNEYHCVFRRQADL